MDVSARRADEGPKPVTEEQDVDENWLAGVLGGLPRHRNSDLGGVGSSRGISYSVGGCRRGTAQVRGLGRGGRGGVGAD
jgi:hypothetical protein